MSSPARLVGRVGLCRLGLGLLNLLGLLSVPFSLPLRIIIRSFSLRTPPCAEATPPPSDCPTRLLLDDSAIFALDAAPACTATAGFMTGIGANHYAVDVRSRRRRASLPLPFVLCSCVAAAVARPLSLHHAVHRFQVRDREFKEIDGAGARLFDSTAGPFLPPTALKR